MNILPGSPNPLGATWDGSGVNFALYSEHATGVELCLFDEAGVETRGPLPRQTAFVWHGYVSGLQPGQRYGYRVAGPYEPEKGLRFNPSVVLLDPYAKAVDGLVQWDRGCFAYDLGNPKQDLEPSQVEALGAPRGLIVDQSFDWEDDAPLRIPLARSVIYEAHVRGLTLQHPEVPPELRGTYAGLCHPAILKHLHELGVTAIELLPVHAFVDDKFLLDKGLRNYWGYNSLGFFAPDVRYRMGTELGSEVRQFKEMVKTFHRAGIEVILDVVYNHTAEGNQFGPTFSFRGIDNPTYYRLVKDNPRFYFDYTGTGNTLNAQHPQVLGLIMDSVRYWAEEMHVDGFRFDLASALARTLSEVDRLSSFFTLIHDSPALRDVKLIAEPWDVGAGGYQVGNFPVRWAEWNGRYRDTMRSFWKGDGGQAGEIGLRLTGSSDLYESSGRRPSASINFITAHDGFTLNDLVTYDHKHNDANGENSADGNDNEHSWNCGAEGPTDDAGVNALRRRQRRNLLATLLLSQGTPMIVAGDEFGRTQGGNNNAYCQDNAISWIDWQWNDGDRDLLAFTRRVLQLRRDHPSLHRSKFFEGRPIYGTELKDLAWFRTDGEAMSPEDWSNPATRSLGMFLAGRGIDDVDDEGRPLVDDNLLLLVNASHVDLDFKLPVLPDVRSDWEVLLDTEQEAPGQPQAVGAVARLAARSLKLLRAPSRVVRNGGAVHQLGSTYRLQLLPQLGFAGAREAVDYLADLGVSDVYASPIFAAAHGSTHGYDVVDHARLNPELGSDADFQAWTDALKARGLGLLLDWVPNHMGIASGQNAWWEEVLESGPSAIYAEAFDIDWTPPKSDLKDSILVPVLGDQYGQVLERGELQVVHEAGTFKLAYFDQRFPLGPKTLAPLLADAAARSKLSPQDPFQQELESIRASVEHLPSPRDLDEASRQERAREKEVIKRRLARVQRKSKEIAAAFDEALRALNGEPGKPESFDRLDQLLRQQSHRLASWRVAAQEINYRRFFDVNALAALRMEEPAVFDRSHARLFELFDEGRVQGLRLDHTDGLYDPVAYLEALQRHFSDRSKPEASPDDAARPLPLLVEKILEPGELLLPGWPVDGTTGYEFGAAALQLLVDTREEEPFSAFYRRFTGDKLTFDAHVYAAKQAILGEALASEVNMLARRLERIAGDNRLYRDFTLIALTQAIVETLASFSVYRTYLREGVHAGERETRPILLAIREARRRTPALDPTVYDFLQQVLLLRTEGSEDKRRAEVVFALRFQQLTGPVMAKSVEDTAFYRYHRLVCCNEVGSDPARFGISLDSFHGQNAERLRSWPLSMVALSTHDTKRGEDAGARLAVLPELRADWEAAVERWSALARPHKTRLDAGPAPSRRDEYLLYQSLIGAWPTTFDGHEGRAEFAERLRAYFQKALREAKEFTSWARVDVPYERAALAFVERLVNDDRFMDDAAAFAARLGPYGASNGLALTLLRLCSPGIPDTYQGSELWNQSLVDPDNRRPVDFAVRREMLKQIRESTDRPALARGLLERWQDGAVKLYVTHVALQARSKYREVFLRGDYQPIDGGEHVVAFARSDQGVRVVLCVPRFAFELTQGKKPWAVGEAWAELELPVPSGKYENLLTGERVESSGKVKLATLLPWFPAALLVSQS